jgi:hypothetical protein
MSYAKLAKVSLMSCFSGTCGASGRSLVDDFRQALDDNTVKIKSYNDRICFLDDDMAFVFDGGVCVFWVFCCWLSLAV